MRGLVRAWNVAGAMYIVAIFYLSLTPSPPQIPVEQGDKIGHVLAYLGLMLWFAQMRPAWRARAAWALGFVVMGIAIEFLQRETGYRSFEVADMVADAIGVALGWLLAPPRMPNVVLWLERCGSRFGRPS